MSRDALTRAYVVFTGKTDIWWLRFLKAGYRHCFIMLNDGQRWISIDPLAPYTDIQIHHHIEARYDLDRWLSDQGYEVIETKTQVPHHKPAPLMLYTCVESVKRILGIHCWRVMTPWQLYRYLKK